MKDATIMFDIDGTLRSNKKSYPHGDTQTVIPNEQIRQLLVILSGFKNVTVGVWSGAGELYARQVVRELGLSSYIDLYAGKEDADSIQPTIAIDDMQSCNLGSINLIVREK